MFYAAVTHFIGFISSLDLPCGEAEVQNPCLPAMPSCAQCTGVTIHMYSMQFISPYSNCGLPEMFLLVRQIRNQKCNCVLGTHSIASQIIPRSTQQLSCSLRCSSPSPGAGQQLARPPAPLCRVFHTPLSPRVLCLISQPDIFAVIFPKR